MARTVLYAAVLFVGASCGAPEVGKTPAPAQTTPSASASASASAPAVGPTPSGGPSQAVPMVTEMKPVIPTAMELRLREIGLDPTALPPLNKLDPKALRDVMNTFTKALGVKCSHCHEKDFKAPTANKKIATHMWDEFTRGLAFEGGGPLYCDSCHEGQARFLDRSNAVRLGDYMQANYVDHVKRTDNKDHSCETCHGEPFVGPILTKRWK